MSDFRKRTINALSWSLGSKFTSQAISIVFGIVLARLLVPEDFGLIAMVMVLMGFAGLLADVGLGAALIQKKDVNDNHYSSVFWLNTVIGIVLTILMVILSPLIAAFYKQPELGLITTLLAVNFVFGALEMVPRTYLSKELAFRELALIDLVSMILSGTVAIALAAKGYGYWSLVVQRLVSRLLSVLLVWRVSNWRPVLRFSFSSIRELIVFSSSVFFTRSIRYTALQTDKLLIGKLLSASSLGLYDKAYSLMLFPLGNISHVISQVMFPSLSQIQDDIERIRDAYLRLTRAISLFTFPMMVGMFMVVDSFVPGVLGEQWTRIIPLFKIFSIAGIFMSIATVTGAIYLSLGHAKLQLRVNLVNQPLQIIGVIIGLNWGLQGVATGYAITTILGVFYTWHFAGRLIQLGIGQILWNLLPTLILSLLMGIAVRLTDILYASYNNLQIFIFQTLSGILIYTLLLIIVKPSAYQDILSVFAKEYSKN